MMPIEISSNGKRSIQRWLGKAAQNNIMPVAAFKQTPTLHDKANFLAG
jgi:hypothetical protein